MWGIKISVHFVLCCSESNPMPRVPGLTWLSAGQLDGMNDEVRSLLNVDQTIVYKMTLTDEAKSLLNVDQTIVSKMMLKVMEAWMGSGKSANIRCLDLDRWQACDVFLVKFTWYIFLKCFNELLDFV